MFIFFLLWCVLWSAEYIFFQINMLAIDIECPCTNLLSLQDRLKNTSESLPVVIWRLHGLGSSLKLQDNKVK